MTGEAGMGLWRTTKREQTHFDAVLWEKLAAVAQVRMVALLVHHHACDSCGHSNEAHDGIEPLQADRVDDEATAETRKDANNYSCENLEGLQLGVDMFVQLHLLHGHAIDCDVIPHNGIHAGPQHEGEYGIAEHRGYCCNQAICRRAEHAPQKKVGLEMVTEERQRIKA